VNFDATPSKCMPPALYANFSGHHFNLLSQTLKTFSAMPTHTMYTCKVEQLLHSAMHNDLFINIQSPHHALSVSIVT